MTGPTDRAWAVITLSPAKKKLLRLPREERERFIAAFETLARALRPRRGQAPGPAKLAAACGLTAEYISRRTA